MNSSSSDSKISIKDFPYDIYIEIIEWMSLTDAIAFCEFIGLPLHESFQHHQFSFAKDGRFKNNCQLLKSMFLGRSDFFDFLCLNTRFNRIFSIQDKLMIACELGYTNQIQMLMNDPRLDPGAEDNRAIRISCGCGFEQVVRLLLLDPRVDPSAMHNFPLLIASLHGFTEIVRLLLADYRVSTVPRNNAVVVAASRQGHAKVVQLLLSADMKYCRSTLSEAMMSAHSRGHTEVVKILAEYLGLDPNNISF